MIEDAVCKNCGNPIWRYKPIKERKGPVASAAWMHNFTNNYACPATTYAEPRDD